MFVHAFLVVASGTSLVRITRKASRVRRLRVVCARRIQARGAESTAITRSHGARVRACVHVQVYQYVHVQVYQYVHVHVFTHITNTESAYTYIHVYMYMSFVFYVYLRFFLFFFSVARMLYTCFSMYIYLQLIMNSLTICHFHIHMCIFKSCA